MKTTLHTVLLSCLLFFTGQTLQAQTATKSYFNSLFEDYSVGLLHIHIGAFPEETAFDSVQVMPGQPIPLNCRSFMPT
ncbi:MAG: hypothetical protein KDC44_12840, partial [Phaeodactylibacter sp.]|nr:hypothetical protein [Phaeodactylibacter sp.]